MTRHEKQPVTFDDGRQGYQHVAVHDDGGIELMEVVVTREADGRACRHVYARRSDLTARVYGLGDLNATWEIDPARPSQTWDGRRWAAKAARAAE